MLGRERKQWGLDIVSVEVVQLILLSVAGHWVMMFNIGVQENRRQDWPMVGQGVESEPMGLMSPW